MCLDLNLVTFSLRASSPGRAGKGRRACNYVFEIWIPPPIPLWLPVDWAVRFSPISAKPKRARMQTNIEKHVPRVMTSILVSSLPITISHRLFWCTYSNSRDVAASSPSFSHPAARLSRRASSDAGSHLGLPKKKKQTNKQIQRWKKVKWWLTLKYFKILAKDTANPLSHHALASLNFFNWMKALAPITV